MSHVIAIGICTYMRKKELSRSLDSIKKLILPSDIPVHIVVCDNDPEGTAEEIVKNFKIDEKAKIYYVLETQRGIPYARNSILKKCLDLEITELFFIDDDEYADTRWMMNLWNYYKENNADIVTGPVVSVYSQETPNWIQKSSIIQRKNHEMGEVRNSAATGNVLFNFRKIVKENNIFFNESFGLRGGSDSEYFRRAIEKGFQIQWVSNAYVYEVVDDSRITTSYALKRNFRINNNKIIYKKLSFFRRSRKFVFSIIYFMWGLLNFPYYIVQGNKMYMVSLMIVVKALGKMLGSIGIYIEWEEYR